MKMYITIHVKTRKCLCTAILITIIIIIIIILYRTAVVAEVSEVYNNFHDGF